MEATNLEILLSVVVLFSAIALYISVMLYFMAVKERNCWKNEASYFKNRYIELRNSASQLKS